MAQFLSDINVIKEIATTTLLLNGSSTGKTSVVSSLASTSNNIITLPIASGTVSLTSHTHNYAGSASVGGPATSANKVNSSLVLKFDTGTTENTSLYTFDGSASKTIDIKGGTNVSLTKVAGVITINSSYINTTYTASTGLTLNGTEFSVNYGTIAGTATQGNDSRLSDARTPVAHIHGSISNDGKIGTSPNLPITTGTNGTLSALAAGIATQYLNGLGAWGTPPDTTYTASSGIKLTNTNFEHTNAVIAGTVSDGGNTRTLAWSGSFNIPSVSYDVQGHITSSGSIAITMPATPPNTTYSAGNGITLTSTTFALGTPSGLTATTTDAVTASSHTHSISTAIAVALSNSSTSTVGTSISLARADHTHSISGFALTAHNHDANNITAGTLVVARGGTGASTLADNKILIGNGTSAIQTDTNLHWDTTNDRFGVRNTAPAETVHVNGNVRVDDAAGNVGFVMAYDNVSKSLQFNFAG